MAFLEVKAGTDCRRTQPSSSTACERNVSGHLKLHDPGTGHRRRSLLLTQPGNCFVMKSQCRRLQAATSPEVSG